MPFTSMWYTSTCSCSTDYVHLDAVHVDAVHVDVAHPNVFTQHRPCPSRCRPRRCRSHQRGSRPCRSCRCADHVARRSWRTAARTRWSPRTRNRKARCRSRAYRSRRRASPSFSTLCRSSYHELFLRCRSNATVAHDQPEDFTPHSPLQSPVSVLTRDSVLVSNLITLLQPRNLRFNQTISSLAVDSKHQRHRN